MTPIPFATTVHAPPVGAEAHGSTLELRFDTQSLFPMVSIFTGSASLTTALAAAINGAIEAHKIEVVGS